MTFNNSKGQVANKPSWTGDELTRQLRRYDRSPFIELLAFWLECAPDAEAVQLFAKRKPDLWVKAMTDLAKISGYTEKQETIHTIRTDQLSDSQLEDRALELAKRLGLPVPNTETIIEAEFEPISPVK